MERVLSEESSGSDESRGAGVSWNGTYIVHVHVLIESNTVM